MFWEYAAEYLRKWWMLELWNLCHYVHHLINLTSRDYWNSSNERKPLFQLEHDLRKCSAISQKWWMLELSNLCHCVQHPWKLTSKDYWSCRNKRKPLSKLKHVLRTCSSNISEMVNARAFKPLPLCSSPHGTLLVGITGHSRTWKKATFLATTLILRKCSSNISEMVNARAFKPLPLCLAHLKTS